MVTSPKPNATWSTRQDELYYHVVSIIVKRLAPRAESIIDVGAGDAEVVNWLPHIGRRVVLDKAKPADLPDVVSIADDFLRWEPDQQYDVALCLQTLDRFKNPVAAARKLKSMAKTVVVTLTEGEGGASEVTDLVTAWFGKEPNFVYRCQEVTSDMVRVVMVFERSSLRWSSIAHRGRLRNAKTLAAAAS
jgi:hypothetical protein